MACCDLPDNLFDDDEDWTEVLSRVSEVDLSLNPNLGVAGVGRFLSACDPNTLKHLNVSGTTTGKNAGNLSQVRKEKERIE